MANTSFDDPLAGMPQEGRLIGLVQESLGFLNPKMAELAQSAALDTVAPPYFAKNPAKTLAQQLPKDLGLSNDICYAGDVTPDVNPEKPSTRSAELNDRDISLG